MSRRTKLQSAIALHQQGQLDAASQLYVDILSTDPQEAECWHMMGVIATQKNDPTLAVELMQHALTLQQGNAALHCNLGFALQATGQLQAALHSYDQAVACDPQFAQAFYNRANAHKALNHNAQALQDYKQALSINPAYCEAHLNAGLVCQDLDQQTQALAHFEQAIALQPQLASAHFNRGNALKALGQAQQALACYDQAIALDAHYAQAHYNRGTVLQDQLALEQAIASYDQAIAADPSYAQAHWNKANCLLLLGKLEQAWPLYEWRWQTPSTGLTARTFKQPLWLGQAPLHNQTILLHCEQGLGDTLQFCRFAQQLAQRGARVVLEVPPALFGLLQRLQGVSHCIQQGDPLPDFDWHCPLLSLPLALGVTLHNLPAQAPYLFADPQKLALWAQKLGARSGPRVGLVWSGSAQHANDKNRSLALSQLLAALPPLANCVSLQKEIRPHDAQTLQQTPQLLHFGDQLQDFEDTAALCSLMDLVISVDTSVAHLAGALGRPTWVLLPHVPDWRWMLNRSDSPWYSAMRLYRQDERRDWSTVLAQLANDWIKHSHTLGATDV